METLFEQVESEVLRKLFYFLTSKEVSQELEAFLDENCESFEGNVEDITGEQDLGRYEQYQEYTRLLETQLARFCKDNHVTQKKLFQEAEDACKETQEDQFNMASLLLDMLMAATEYQMFCVNCSTFKAFKKQRAQMTRTAAKGGKAAKAGGESKYDDADRNVEEEEEEEQKRFEGKYADAPRSAARASKK